MLYYYYEGLKKFQERLYQQYYKYYERFNVILIYLIFIFLHFENNLGPPPRPPYYVRFLLILKYKIEKIKAW